MTDDLCNNCGKCCYFPIGVGGILQACPHLEKRESKFHCSVYESRLNRVIGTYKGNDVRCNYYNSLSSEIVGCPLNLGGKQMRDVMIPEHGEYRLAQGVLK